MRAKCCFLCIVLFAVMAAAGEFVPTKEITMIVPSSAGGGSDLNARTIASIVQKNNFSPRNIMVVNNGGGSGAVGFTNTFARKGDDHTLMILHSGQVMGSYVNNWDVKASDLTYVALLAFDNLFLCVKKGSGLESLDKLVKASRAAPEEIAVGGAQRGNSDHLSFELFNRETKAQASYVFFNGSGDVMSNLLGDHINAGIFNPLECIGQIQAGVIVPIACYGPKRLGGIFKDVPTFIELGYPGIDVVESRAISGPPGMSPDAVAFYVEMLRKVTETGEWKKDYIEKNYLDPVFYDAAKTKEFYESQIEGFKKAFEGVDLGR
ncbi:MAG: tripartite tricarboxylate transporter substrate binding protein [Planctomycetota bacterium]|jgi:putative tricarboxylic transport membrane protein|nr:tripartite tricarboxylate transporter substrate binding protein [Planctomycetota bacterium]